MVTSAPPRPAPRRPLMVSCGLRRGWVSCEEGGDCWPMRGRARVMAAAMAKAVVRRRVMHWAPELEEKRIAVFVSTRRSPKSTCFATVAEGCEE